MTLTEKKEEILAEIEMDNDLGCCGGDLCNGSTSHNEYLKNFLSKVLDTYAESVREEAYQKGLADNCPCKLQEGVSAECRVHYLEFRIDPKSLQSQKKGQTENEV